MSNSEEQRTYTIPVNIPFTLPSDEQLEAIKPHMFVWQKELVATGKYTEEELVSFSDFLQNGQGLMYTMLDPFVAALREIKSPKSGLIVPNQNRKIITS